MAFLPTLGFEYNEREVTDTFRGYNHNLKIDEGEFFHTENLTSALFPLLANRKKRGRVARLQAPGGLAAKEKLAWVDGGTLYYGGEATPLRNLSPGEKQLVSMGACLCVFPDKVYYNTADAADFGSMEAVYRSAGAVEFTLCREDGEDCPRPRRRTRKTGCSGWTPGQSHMCSGAGAACTGSGRWRRASAPGCALSPRASCRGCSGPGTV